MEKKKEKKGEEEGEQEHELRCKKNPKNEIAIRKKKKRFKPIKSLIQISSKKLAPIIVCILKLQKP